MSEQYIRVLALLQQAAEHACAYASALKEIILNENIDSFSENQKIRICYYILSNTNYFYSADNLCLFNK